jgi:hypothetical protein
MTLSTKKKPAKKIDDSVVDAFADQAETVEQKIALPRRNSHSALNTTRKQKNAAQDKVIRDSFTMPGHDYALIETIKLKLMKEGSLLNKGEILRAGLHALEKMDINELIALAQNIDKIKVGRRPD